MFEQVVLLAQLLSVAALAAWLTIGLWDNIRYPENNALFTSQVMEMSRLRDTFPAEYARVSHRAVDSPALHRAAFRLVVLAEIAAALLLWAGSVALILAWTGTTAIDTARALALLGALAFTCIWAGFLVVGNYFCYWFCHEDAQNTHYQMTLWGLGTMIFLVLG